MTAEEFVLTYILLVIKQTYLYIFYGVEKMTLTIEKIMIRNK